MAVMADFARMPTSRKVMVFVVIGAVLGGLYFQFVYKSLNEKVEEAEADHSSKVQQNKKLAEVDIPSFEKLKTRMGVLKRIIDENQKALPTEAELPAFFEMLNRKVTEAGVEVTRFNQQAEAPVESFVKVPVEIELTGTFMQIKKFFASLLPRHNKGEGEGAPEERERIVSIEDLSLSNPTVKTGSIVLTAKFTAVTYRQEEKKEEEPKAGAKPGTKPGTVQPPASTPAGAKARTEDALDKGQKRNDDKLKGGM